jgi:hypothetical protein
MVTRFSATGGPSPASPVPSLQRHLRQALGHLHDPGYWSAIRSALASRSPAGLPERGPAPLFVAGCLRRLTASVLPPAEVCANLARNRCTSWPACAIWRTAQSVKCAISWPSATPNTTGGTAACSPFWRPASFLDGKTRLRRTSVGPSRLSRRSGPLTPLLPGMRLPPGTRGRTPSLTALRSWSGGSTPTWLRPKGRAGNCC